MLKINSTLIIEIYYNSYFKKYFKIMKNINQIPKEKEYKESFTFQKQLCFQSYTLKNLSEISPLTKEIMSRQPTINIVTIGENSKGKTTLVQSLSETLLSKPKAEKEPERIREKEKNISQMLGYINSKLYKCKKCPTPECYKSYSGETDDMIKCKTCDSNLELLRHISFIDEPKFKIKMVKLLNYSWIMDGALLLIAANENNGNDQEDDSDKEKYFSMENTILKNIIIIQNKIDTVMKYNSAKEQYGNIKKYANFKNAATSPIIPVSAQLKFNLDVINQYLSFIPIPKRDFISSPRFIIIYSLDCNYQIDGNYINNNLNFKSGMLYGLIIKGILKIGDQLEIRPGICIRVSNKDIRVNPINTKIVSLQAEKNNMIFAVPGGITNIGLKIDPLLCRRNRLEGNVGGSPDKMEDIFIKLAIKCHLLRRLISINGKNFWRHLEFVPGIKKGEVLMLNINFNAVGGIVLQIEGNNNDEILFLLKKPICLELSEKISISRRIENSWRIIGWGEVISGGETIV